MKRIIKKKIRISSCYTINTNEGKTLYTAKRKHLFHPIVELYDEHKKCLGYVKRTNFLTAYPHCFLYLDDMIVGELTTYLSTMRPDWKLHYRNWDIPYDKWDFDLDVRADDQHIMHIYKENLSLFSLYEIDIYDKKEEIICLLIVLAMNLANNTIHQGRTR